MLNSSDAAKVYLLFICDYRPNELCVWLFVAGKIFKTLGVNGVESRCALCVSKQTTRDRTLFVVGFVGVLDCHYN